MSAAILAWWHALSAREQWLIRIMLSLLGVVVLLFAVVRPLATFSAASHDRLENATRLHAQAAGLERRPQVQAPQTPLADRIAASAREAGCDAAMQPPDPDGSVRVTLASARAPALYGWIAALEKTGVTVRAATLSTKSDATLSATLTMGEAR